MVCPENQKSAREVEQLSYYLDYVYTETYYITLVMLLTMCVHRRTGFVVCASGHALRGWPTLDLWWKNHQMEVEGQSGQRTTIEAQGENRKVRK